MFNGGTNVGGTATADYFLGTTTTTQLQRYYQVEADWLNTGRFDSTYSDLTDYVLHLSARRGRVQANPLRGRCEPGKLTVVLDNRSGLFSQFNALSPLNGYLLPGRLLRWRAIAPSFYQRWQGKISEFKLDRMNGLPVVIIEARGPIADIENIKVNPVADSGSLTGTILGKILDAASWSSTLRDIDVGQTTTSRWYKGESFALDASREIEETELGLISESKDGKIVFRDRAYRVGGARLTSQATYSDAPGATLPYNEISLPAPVKEIVNRARAIVTPYTVAALADLWTLTGETPTIGPGQTKTWYATVTSPTLYVDAWTTLVATTDYTVSGVALGDLAVVCTKYASVMVIAVTNNHATNTATMTLLKARGTAVVGGTPTAVSSENAASIAAYGLREYPLPSKWLPNTNTAQSYVDSIVAANKDTLALPELKFNVGIGGANSALFVDLMTRDIHDRVTVVAQQPQTGAGLSGEFFIEYIEDEWDVQRQRHDVKLGLSQTTAAGSSWILGTSILGTNTYIGF